VACQDKERVLKAAADASSVTLQIELDHGGIDCMWQHYFFCNFFKISIIGFVAILSDIDKQLTNVADEQWSIE
jgi:hypothetical protein